MATSQGVKLLSGNTGSAITVYRLVSLAADGFYDHTGADAEPHGVSAETVATGGLAFPFAMPNGAVVKVEVGAAGVTRGTRLVAVADGKVVDGADAGAGNYWVGTALEAGSDGQIISMLFAPHRDDA